MASLRENFDLSLDTDLRIRTVMALNSVATTRLLSSDPTAADYDKEIQAIRSVMGLSVDQATAIVRLLVSAGLTNQSTDAQIEGALTNNWDTFRNLFDATVVNSPFGG